MNSGQLGVVQNAGTGLAGISHTAGLGSPISHTYGLGAISHSYGLGQSAGDRVKEFFASTNTYIAFGVGAAVGAAVMALLKR